MNLICKLRDHDWEFIREIPNSGIYSFKWDGQKREETQLLPAKEYRCKRCPETIKGTGVTEEDAQQVRNIMLSAKAQQAYAMSQLPNEINMLRQRIEKIEEKVK